MIIPNESLVICRCKDKSNLSPLTRGLPLTRYINNHASIIILKQPKISVAICKDELKGFQFTH